jgi:hypothetical protein
MVSQLLFGIVFGIGILMYSTNILRAYNSFNRSILILIQARLTTMEISMMSPKIVVGVPKVFGAVFGAVFGVCGMEINGAIAQVPPPPVSQQSLQEFQQPTQSGFALGSNGTGLNLLQLLQNANLLNSKSAAEVSAGQKETIDEASIQFRKQQRQQLGITNPALVDGTNRV